MRDTRDGESLRFSRTDGGLFVLTTPACVTMRRYRQIRPNQTEAGGVLLGRLILDAQDVVVDRVTEPATSDQRSRFSFWRSQRTTQQLVNDAWRQSGGTQQYLGEWHTHPEDDPTPSGVDRRNWQRILREAHFESEALWFVIVGRRAVRVWEGDRSGPLTHLALVSPPRQTS
jgi:integrative and conjugative element protein (TIGR02256 family)